MKAERGGASIPMGSGPWTTRCTAIRSRFLAGYRSEACGGGVDCAGLPVVYSLDHLTGEVYPPGSAIFDSRRSALRSPAEGKFKVELVDLHGRVLAVRGGWGRAEAAFDRSVLAPGLYFLRVHSGNGPARARPYLVVPPVRPAE